MAGLSEPCRQGLVFKEYRMIIHTYEKGGRGVACADYLRENIAGLGIDEVIILPIPTTRDLLHLKDSDILLADIEKTVSRGTFVIGYLLPESFRDSMQSRGAIVYDAGRDEEFLVKNADLTAICTLGILLDTETRVPREMTFGIVGYGRIGKKLVRMLLFLGAGVRVYTSRDNMRLELCEFGVASSMSAKEADLDGLDVLINTAPAVIFDTGNGAFPEKLRVIDLASGENFPGIEVERYPSVPARMFPVSAGVILGEAAESFLRDGHMPREK